MAVMLLSGCDSEIHKRMLIRGVGIDFKDSCYSISVRAENVINSEETLVLTEGETVFEALENLSMQSGNKQMYADSYYIIYGESMRDKGIEDTLDFFIRYFKALPTEQIFFAEGSANEIMALKENGKLIPSGFIRNLKNSKDNSGKTVSVDLLEFLSDVTSPSETSLIPVISAQEEKIKLNGAFVTKGYYPVMRITGKEIMWLRIAKGDIESASVVFDYDDNKKISLEIDKVNCSINTDSLPEICLEIQINSSAAQVSGINADAIIDIDLAEEKSETVLKEKIVTTLNKCYKKGLDVLAISNILYDEKRDSVSDLSKLTFKTDVKMMIKRNLKYQ